MKGFNKNKPNLKLLMFTPLKKIKQLPLSYKDNDSSGGIFFAIKDHWKRIRSLLNPTFSQSKLKQTEPYLNKCLDRLVDTINKKNQKEFVISE